MTVNISWMFSRSLIALVSYKRKRKFSLRSALVPLDSFTIYDKSHYTGHFHPPISLIQGQRRSVWTRGLCLFIFVLLSSLLLSHIWVPGHIIHHKMPDITNLPFVILRNAILNFSREGYYDTTGHVFIH